MTNLSPGGGDLVNSFKTYDYRLSTFTVPTNTSLPVASPLLLTGSEKTFIVNSAKNVAAADASVDDFMVEISTALSGLITTTSTDDYVLRLQASTDNGTTWSDLQLAAIPAASINKRFGRFYLGTTVFQSGVALTQGKFIIRTVISDATDPSTDALTITNIRTTCLFQLMV